MDESSGGRVFVTTRTGGGKSLMLYMTAAAVGGITLCIIPLLSLTANQLEQITTAVQRWGAFYAVHLEDTGRHDVKEKVIPEMNSFPYDSSSSMIILCSPQYIAENLDFRNAF